MEYATFTRVSGSGFMHRWLVSLSFVDTEDHLIRLAMPRRVINCWSSRHISVTYQFSSTCYSVALLAWILHELPVDRVHGYWKWRSSLKLAINNFEALFTIHCLNRSESPNEFLPPFTCSHDPFLFVLAGPLDCSKTFELKVRQETKHCDLGTVLSPSSRSACPWYFASD